jgi:hypothetical protein
MASTPTPVGNDNFLTDMDIRIWLRDNDPEANVLIDDFEFSAEEIRTAQTLTVDYWNETPPAIQGYNYDKFPYRYALLRGTAANLLFIAANRFRRNEAQYNAGGLQFNSEAKHQQYDAAGSRLWEEYKQWVRMKKREINANNGWGVA